MTQPGTKIPLNLKPNEVIGMIGKCSYHHIRITGALVEARAPGTSYRMYMLVEEAWDRIDREEYVPLSTPASGDVVELTRGGDVDVVLDESVIESVKLAIDAEADFESLLAQAIEFHSGDDKLMEMVVNAHLRYERSFNPDSSPMIKEGIAFYLVGHNASHEFYMGVKDDRLYAYSYGESGWDEEDNPEYEGHLRDITTDEWAYLGHR